MHIYIHMRISTYICRYRRTSCTKTEGLDLNATFGEMCYKAAMSHRSRHPLEPSQRRGEKSGAWGGFFNGLGLLQPEIMCFTMNMWFI